MYSQQLEIRYSMRTEETQKGRLPNTFYLLSNDFILIDFLTSSYINTFHVFFHALPEKPKIRKITSHLIKHDMKNRQPTNTPLLHANGFTVDDKHLIIFIRFS